MEVAAPVGIVEVGISDGIAAVDHPAITHIESAMSDSVHISAHCPFKEYHITGAGVLWGNRLTGMVQASCTKSASIPHAGGCVNIREETRAVKRGLRAITAPYIGITNILVGFGDEQSEVRISIKI